MWKRNVRIGNTHLTVHLKRSKNDHDEYPACVQHTALTGEETFREMMLNTRSVKTALACGMGNLQSDKGEDHAVTAEKEENWEKDYENQSRDA